MKPHELVREIIAEALERAHQSGFDEGQEHASRATLRERLRIAEQERDAAVKTLADHRRDVFCDAAWREATGCSEPDEARAALRELHAWRNASGCDSPNKLADNLAEIDSVDAELAAWREASGCKTPDELAEVNAELAGGKVAAWREAANRLSPALLSERLEQLLNVCTAAKQFRNVWHNDDMLQNEKMHNAVEELIGELGMADKYGATK